jgi:hypothetical protein
MTDQHQHRATPEQWKHLENGAQLERPYNSALCLLELRDRIAALEAAQASTRGILGNSPAGSLVERVTEAIVDGMLDGDCNAARAAIREVAAWLREQGTVSWSTQLDREATNG